MLHDVGWDDIKQSISQQFPRLAKKAIINRHIIVYTLVIPAWVWPAMVPSG
jgi:hypothetical protein